MDIEMFGQLLPEQASAPDSATTYGFAGPVTGTLPPLLSHQLIPNLGHAIKGPISNNYTVEVKLKNSIECFPLLADLIVVRRCKALEFRNRAI